MSTDSDDNDDDNLDDDKIQEIEAKFMSESLLHEQGAGDNVTEIGTKDKRKESKDYKSDG